MLELWWHILLNQRTLSLSESMRYMKSNAFWRDLWIYEFVLGSTSTLTILRIVETYFLNIFYQTSKHSQFQRLCVTWRLHDEVECILARFVKYLIFAHYSNELAKWNMFTSILEELDKLYLQLCICISVFVFQYLNLLIICTCIPDEIGKLSASSQVICSILLL